MLIKLARLFRSVLLIYAALTYLLLTPRPFLQKGHVFSKDVSISIAQQYPLVALDVLPIVQGIPYPANYNAIAELYAFALSTGVTPVIMLFINGTLIVGAPLDTVKDFTDKDAGKHKNWVRALEADSGLTKALRLDALPSLGFVATLAGKSGIHVSVGTVLGEPPLHGETGEQWDVAGEVGPLGRSGICTVIGGLSPFTNYRDALKRLDEAQLTVVSGPAGGLHVAHSLVSAHQRHKEGEGAKTLTALNELKAAELLYQLRKDRRGLVFVVSNQPQDSDSKTTNYNVTTLADKILLEIKAKGLRGTSASQYAREELVRLTHNMAAEEIIESMRNSITAAATIARCAMYGSRGVRGHVLSLFNTIAYTAYRRDDLDRRPFECRRLPLYDTFVAFAQNPLFASISIIYHMYFLTAQSSVLFKIGRYVAFGVLINGVLAAYVKIFN